MKSLYIPILFISLLFSACTPGNLGYTEALDRNNRKLETEDQRRDAEFLVEATDYNILLNELSSEAAEKAYSRVVTDFARQNLQDHMTMTNRLKDLSKEKKIAIPSHIENRHENTLRDMDTASKESVDKVYLNAIETLHNRLLRLYEDAALNANDDKIRSYAAAQLDILRSHYRKAEEIRRELI